MGYRDNIEVDIGAMLLKVPVAFRTEVSDGLCARFGFENWRLSQIPEVDDTPANRLAYIKVVLADEFAGFLVKRVISDRQADVVIGVDAELDA